MDELGPPEQQIDVPIAKRICRQLPRLRWIGAKSAKQLSSTAERHHCAMRPNKVTGAPPQRLAKLQVRTGASELTAGLAVDI